MSAALTSDFLARHLARVIQSSDDAIVSKDLNGIIVSWNPAAERMFGYTAAEAVGQSIRMIIPPDRQSEEDAVLEKVRAGEALTHFETVRLRKSGTLIPISLTVSPIHDDAGVIIGVSSIARDLSERGAADLVARRLAAVVQSSDDAIVTKDLNGVITSWNPAAERMFGYTEAEAIGRSIRILIPEDRQEEEDSVLARIRAGQTVDHFETIRRRKDGTQLNISLTVSPIRNDAGVVVGASKVARDITERSRLMAAVREQAAITAKINDVAIAASSTLDREAVVRKITGVATQIMGAEFGALCYVTEGHWEGCVLDTGSGASECTFARFGDEESGGLFDVNDSEPAVRLEDLSSGLRYQTRPREFAVLEAHRPVRAYIRRAVRAVSGGVIGRLSFGHSRAGAFTEHHDQLIAGIAAWATVALENARLYVEAQQANRVKDEFLAVLSHELRTPLNAIVGYARLLRGGVLTGEKAERGLETLERNASSLAQIVDDVLDISRIVSGKIRLDVQAVELPLIVHNAVATVQPAADAKAVHIETIVDPRVGAVSGDPNRLQQVAWNLLSNAVKFTPKGGRVQVLLESAASDVELVVTDTGVGIPSEFLPHVFERFRQADAGTARTTGGLGLGLAIVRHIVELHGGSVVAFSDGIGKGSTFRVRLPLRIAHRASGGLGPHPRYDVVHRLSAPGTLNGTRVLAVDDEEDNGAVLREILEAAGAAVTTLTSGQQALDALETFQPDVLVIDLGMPRMDGFELITRVRASANAAIRRIPAAALTAFARAEDRTRALHSGFEMHLPKPVDPGELVASVAALAKRARDR